ncbi:MAG: SPASM domain-containing protein [Patescibacteria group bacterium]
MARSFSFHEGRHTETVKIGCQCIKKILTLDFNLPGDDVANSVNQFPPGSPEANHAFGEGYKCTMKCPLCFNEAALKNYVLYTKEVYNFLDQARPLGLESLKFLGPGELLEKKELWDMLEYTRKHNIILGIFTKAGVLGSDWLARKYHGIDSMELLNRLLEYPNLNFYLEGRSFDPVWENRFVPIRDAEDAKHVNYYEVLCIAYERLCAAGVNADLANQRMTIQCNPVTHQNISGVFEIYKWGIERNMPVYLPPTMVSGKGHLGEGSAMEELFIERYIALAVQVYTWAIERGVLTLPQFLSDGPHPYIGNTPCNQLTHGMYVHADGRVWRCPGNDNPDFEIDPDIRKTPLKDIWMNSKNYRTNAFNNHCVKDGFSLPVRFYTEVKKRVEQELRPRQ